MKALFVYIIIVGVLFLGLLGILQVGERIEAPADISGVWRPVAEFSSELRNSCGSIQFDDPVITVEQSGIYIFILLNDAAVTRLQGKMKHNKMMASGTIPVNYNIKGCGNKTRLVLTSEFLKTEDGRPYFSGVLSTPECEDCAKVYFSALKKNIRNPED